MNIDELEQVNKYQLARYISKIILECIKNRNEEIIYEIHSYHNIEYYIMSGLMIKINIDNENINLEFGINDTPIFKPIQTISNIWDKETKNIKLKYVEQVFDAFKNTLHEYKCHIDNEIYKKRMRYTESL